MQMVVTPSTATLGAAVHGIELRALDDASWSAIERAFHEHAVLVFPEQFLDDAEQSAFGRRFGRFERGMGFLGTATVWPISNVQADGLLADPGGPLAAVLAGNQEWHTDSSYHEVGAKVSLLSARVTSSAGGETEWADMRAAYDALDHDDRALIADRDAAHSIVYSQRKLGAGADFWTDADKASMRAVRHPLVVEHPATKRRALYVGRHAHAVSGLDDDASSALVDRLNAFACQAPRVFTHRWEPGDLAVWDNRCVLHRGRPWPMDEPRVRIAGDGPNDWALAEPA